MNAVVQQQPDSTRRRLLQFSAGASAQAFLPGVPLSPVSIATKMVSPVASAVTMTENFAGFMALALSHSTWRSYPIDELLNINPLNLHTRMAGDLAQGNYGRLESIFSFHMLFGEKALLAAQKTEAWNVHLMNEIHREKSTNQNQEALLELKKTIQDMLVGDMIRRFLETMSSQKN